MAPPTPRSQRRPDDENHSRYSGFDESSLSRFSDQSRLEYQRYRRERRRVDVVLVLIGFALVLVLALAAWVGRRSMYL